MEKSYVLDIYPKIESRVSERYLCTVFLAALFLTAKRGKQTEGPLTEGWINEMWFIQWTMIPP